MRALQLLPQRQLRGAAARDLGKPLGDAYNNAMAESFFASLECELINRRSWESQAEARTALFTWKGNTGQD